MIYLNKISYEVKAVKRVFALTIILFISMVMVSGFGCKKKVETKKVKAQKTVQSKATVPLIDEDKKMDEKNISDEFLHESPEEIKVEEKVNASIGYIYDPGDRQDPFIPLLVTKKQKKETKIVQNAPPLESFDVKEFRVIATAVSTSDEFYALLLAPDKKSYTVTEGEKLGFHMGKIKEINMNEVIVEEYEENHLNELEMKRVTLKLRRDDT